MTGFKGTPGRWAVVPSDKAEHPFVIGDAEGRSIASCEPVGPWTSPEEASANAKAISAVPVMIEALEKALVTLKDAHNQAALEIREFDGGELHCSAYSAAAATVAEALKAAGIEP